MRKAAEQNFSWAQYTLGGFYCGYDGVKRDDIEAYKWLSLWIAQKREKIAAEAGAVGDPDAGKRDLEEGRKLIAKISRRMTAEQIAEGKQRVATFVSKNHFQ